MVCVQRPDHSNVLFGFCGDAGAYPDFGTVSLPVVAGSETQGLAQSSGLAV